MTNKEYMEMDPLDLLDYWKNKLKFNVPEQINTKEEKDQATAAITKASSYEAYFVMMETNARLLKRKYKGVDKDEYERYIGIEDVSKSFKDICKIKVEAVTKMMTIKRLGLDEAKACGQIRP